MNSYAFALEETNERERAEKLLRKILAMNAKTPWALHAMSKLVCSADVLLTQLYLGHVMEESHVAKDGVEFLTATRPNWENSAFGNHIAWHLTLRYFG